MWIRFILCQRASFHFCKCGIYHTSSMLYCSVHPILSSDQIKRKCCDSFRVFVRQWIFCEKLNSHSYNVGDIMRFGDEEDVKQKAAVPSTMTLWLNSGCNGRRSHRNGGDLRQCRWQFHITGGCCNWIWHCCRTIGADRYRFFLHWSLQHHNATKPKPDKHLTRSVDFIAKINLCNQHMLRDGKLLTLQSAEAIIVPHQVIWGWYTWQEA